MIHSGKLIQALWPLPGGNKRYLHTLDQIVKWVSSTTEPNRDGFNAWLMSEYSVGEGSIAGYFQVVTAMGVMSVQADGGLKLTALGNKLLEAEGDTKARIVIERLMSHYLAFPEVLAFYAQSNESMHLKDLVKRLKPFFPHWTSDAQYEYRALWLLSLGCLHQDRGRYYIITDLGQEIATQFPPQFNVTIESQKLAEGQEKVAINASLVQDKISLLIADLEDAATDSQSPHHFEKAVADAFTYLGFSVDQLGEAGDTDVLLRANMGPVSYTVIVDAKARRDGKLQDLDVYTILDHLRKNQSDYAIVVAGRFAGGKVVQHAEENQIVLLSVPVLSKWLRLHNSIPLNLHSYRLIFKIPGLVEDLPTALLTVSEKRQHLGQLIVDLVELIEETYGHGLLQWLPTNELFTMMVTRLRGVHYSQQELREVVNFLTHPIILAAIQGEDSGIALTMNRGTLSQALHALANQIETVEAVTQE